MTYTFRLVSLTCSEAMLLRCWVQVHTPPNSLCWQHKVKGQSRNRQIEHRISDPGLQYTFRRPLTQWQNYQEGVRLCRKVSQNFTSRTGKIVQLCNSYGYYGVLKILGPACYFCSLHTMLAVRPPPPRPNYSKLHLLWLCLLFLIQGARKCLNAKLVILIITGTMSRALTKCNGSSKM